MTFDPTKPSASEGTFGEALDATRSNLNDVNDRLKAQENLALASTKNEVVAARGSKATVKDRLAVAINDDGSLKFDSLKNMTWIASGDVPTYVNAQSFTVPGDQTAKYLSGLVLRLMHGTNQIHSVVSVASYVAGTDKTTVSLQLSLLTPALSSVLIGLASLGEVLYEEALLKAIPTEPAWRSETEPALFDLAVPGQPLGAPFVFSRGGKSAPYIDALGHRAWTGPDGPADEYDPATLSYQGKQVYGAATTTYLTRQMWSGAVPGVVGEGGVLPTGWSLSNVGDVQTEIVGTGYDKGFKYLDIRFFGTPSTTIFRLANPFIYGANQGETWISQFKIKAIAGSFTNISTVGGGVVEAIGAHVGTYGYMQKELSTEFEHVVASRTIVEANPSLFFWLSLYVPEMLPIDLTLRITEPQVEKSSFPGRFVGADTDGASAALAADVLTIGPIEAGVIFEQDFTASISGFYPKNDCVISQDATHGLVVSSPTVGAVISGVDVPEAWQGKRFRLLFHADNGYPRSFYFIGAGGVSLGLSQINPGYAGDITIPYGTVALHLRADSVPSNTDVYWGDLKLTELIPFEGWDSDAEGHTILLDTENPLAGQYGGVTSVFEINDGTTNNIYRMYQSPNSGALTVLPHANGGQTSAYSGGTGVTNVLSIFEFNTDTLRLNKTDATNINTATPEKMPAGLCQMRFGHNSYLYGWPLILKRFAVYNRYLPDADLNAMVTK
ncbi:hypothetical protein [Thalassospira sp. MCCC 1A01428]|uniref:hypothetical protein n=1 Tax=Thalassospira sp. MCCC 1A01428 TaxID=1470575 RepID=UPI000A1DE415|nr:hypothetical protein [Thalassospira sp. MCCC 1A01428]OSQ45533.1 hypothetical protein THS27_04155 [Thalassospira sp. MCCC 1A01428]